MVSVSGIGQGLHVADGEICAADAFRIPPVAP
jgi:hypothetical protein